MVLGAPAGRKTDAEYGLPGWLGGASELVQREFLAAYLGGDGPKVDIRQVEREKKLPYNSVNINDLEFHKNERLAKSGMELATSLARLLESFGVRVAKVFSEDEGVVWKNGRRSVILHVRFKHDVETAFSLTRRIGYVYCRIGYVYCRQKQAVAEAAGEFLARIRRRREKWQVNYAMAVQWAKAGVGVKGIADKLGVNAGTVWGWVKEGKKATTNYYKEKFRDWVVGVEIGLKDGLMWDIVDGVGEVFLPKVARISVAANHNFIANGFVVHNCGPCKMSAPVLDQLSEEYAGKAVIFKVDVDKETDLAARFG
ncbi:MAG: thioredoxin [Microgenomates group bacterium Gr01-1014_16]|nr:MAG: thioredoxin [Microgenomates group bacterium Gr01-1014_16]